jgi:hypothetical protein
MKPLPPITTLEHKAALKKAQREALEKALQAAGGNVTATATALGLSRAHTNRLLKEHILFDRAAELRLSAGQGSRVKFGSRAGQVLGARRKAPR